MLMYASILLAMTRGTVEREAFLAIACLGVVVPRTKALLT
eukprot:COSAG02_NODE_4913_length_4840_cov_2.322717_10_plen_40_part_00